MSNNEIERNLQELNSLGWLYTDTQSDTKEITYSDKYLPSSLVDELFQEGKHTFVDKTYTGNGFTFGTLNSTSTKGVTIIIAPTQEVVKSKEASEKEKGITDRSYIYEKCEDEIDIERDEVIFIVADSFLHQLEYFIKWKSKVSRILIDEIHQFMIQAPFRDNLRGLREVVDKNFPDTARVSVTATPMLSQKADIKLISAIKRDKTTIHITPNQEKSLERVKKSLSDGKKVLFATHDVRLIKRLIGDGVLRANFKVGTNLMRSIVEFFPDVEIDAESNLTIISSRGFEGFDLEGKHDVFVFEERSKDYTTFFAQNIYQIIGRSRDGVNYVEWCYLNDDKRRKMPSRERMQKQVASTRISIEKKTTDKNYKDIQTYYIKETNYETGLADKLIFNEERYLLDEEMTMCDENGIEAQYGKYFEERDCVFKQLDEERYMFGLKGIKPSAKTMFENVKTNRAIVKDLGLMDGITPDSYRKDSLEEYLKEYRVYMRRKFWDAPEMVFGCVDEEMSLVGYNVNERALRNAWMCEEILSKEDFVDNFVTDILKDKKKQKQEELGRKSKEYKKWLEEYSINLKDRFIRLVIALSDTEYNIKEKYRNHRDYSILVEVSMDLIEDVSFGFYDAIATEIDIRNATPRILHALLNKELSDGFYGEKGTKERLIKKRKINKLLNNLSKEQALQYIKDDVNSINTKKRKLKAELKDAGFSDEVADSLINEYWELHKDALFNVCTFHERRILETLRSLLQEDSDFFGADIRMARRHDSLVVFGNYGREFYGTVNNFEYLNQKGWFNKQEDVELLEDVELIEVDKWISTYEAPTEDSFGNPYNADLEIEF